MQQPHFRSIFQNLSEIMTSTCYSRAGKGNRKSDEYQVTNIDALNKRSNKNLFKTALEKLNRKYKKHKKINDNLYEVIVIYKEEKDDDAGDERIHDPSVVRSEPTRRKHRHDDHHPVPPPRTRSRYI